MKKDNVEKRCVFQSARVRLMAVAAAAVLVVLMSIGAVSLLMGENARKVELAVSVAEVRDNYPAIYTLISDDGFYESGVILNELAKKLDMRVTVAGYSRRIKLNQKEWQAIKNEGYVEVVSHSYSHKEMADGKDITDEEYYEEIYVSRLFKEDTFGKGLIAFVCPNNQMTERGYEFLEAAGYFAVRRGTRGENPLNPEEGTEPFQWYNLGCMGIGDVESTGGRNAWVDSAIENGTWLIEMWHDISPDGDQGHQPISTQDAEDHMKYVAWQRKNGNIWIASFQDAVRYLREKQNAQVTVSSKGDMEAMIQLTCDRDRLPMESFSDPLTLNVQVPESWNHVFVFQNGRACEVTWLEDSVISFNAVPDGGEIELCALE